MYLLRRQTTLIRPFNFIHLCNIFHVKALDFFSFIPKGTCWARHIKSVDGFVLFRLSYFGNSDLIAIVCHFHIRGRFFGHISWKVAENSASEPSNLKISWGRIPPEPPTKFVPSALAILPPPPPPPQKKKSRYGPVIIFRVYLHNFNIDRIIKYSW